MALIDNPVSPGAPQTCYVWEKGGQGEQSLVKAALNTGRNFGSETDTFAFQYWPESLTDDYQVEYAEHRIPGGSHPLYQWVGGNGRTISFQAVFTSEMNTDHLFLGNSPPAILSPSSLYTVDVSAALNRIRSWMVPSYLDNDSGGSVASIAPPPRLGLAFPTVKRADAQSTITGRGAAGAGGGTGLGGEERSITVILRSAPITVEAWFPNGQIRVASVDLSFSEIVQSSTSEKNNTSSVKFIDRRTYVNASKNYNFKGSNNNPLTGGGF